MSKKVKMITVTTCICALMVVAIVGVVALIQARTSTSFKISYTAKQVNCIVNQKMTQYNGNGTVKKEIVLDELKFNASSQNKVQETPFPDVELVTSDDFGVDYVVYTIVITNSDLTDGNGIDISFKLDLDQDCNLEKEITTAVGENVFKEVEGVEEDGTTIYQLGQINAGEQLTINIKLAVDNIDIDINLVERSFNFNLESIEL